MSLANFLEICERVMKVFPVSAARSHYSLVVTDRKPTGERSRHGCCCFFCFIASYTRKPPLSTATGSPPQGDNERSETALVQLAARMATLAIHTGSLASVRFLAGGNGNSVDCTLVAVPEPKARVICCFKRCKLWLNKAAGAVYGDHHASHRLPGRQSGDAVRAVLGS